MICQVAIFAKWIYPTIRDSFFLFYQNYMNTKLFCQTLEDILLTNQMQMPAARKDPMHGAHALKQFNWEPTELTVCVHESHLTRPTLQ